MAGSLYLETFRAGRKGGTGYNSTYSRYEGQWVMRRVGSELTISCSEGTQNVTSAVSNAFRVMPVKEFRGLRESTHLSRTFSDQGVRLRLRKEARSLAG
jgi:hypothetical protein